MHLVLHVDAASGKRPWHCKGQERWSSVKGRLHVDLVFGGIRFYVSIRYTTTIQHLRPFRKLTMGSLRACKLPETCSQSNVHLEIQFYLSFFPKFLFCVFVNRNQGQFREICGIRENILMIVMLVGYLGYLFTKYLLAWFVFLCFPCVLLIVTQVCILNESLRNIVSTIVSI